MNAMHYKNYSAQVGFDDEDGVFVSRIMGIADTVTFHATSMDELRAAFHEAVDDYIATCCKIGKAPEEPQGSSPRRSEIASLGAASRWGLPKATHAGEREVSGYTIPVFNLPGDVRVISERGFLAIIGAKGRGSSGGHRLARILADPVIKPFFSNNILVAIEAPIRFLNLSNSVTVGYPAEMLKDFCISFSKAKNKGALKTAVQMRYAEYCEAFEVRRSFTS